MSPSRVAVASGCLETTRSWDRGRLLRLDLRPFRGAIAAKAVQCPHSGCRRRPQRTARPIVPNWGETLSAQRSGWHLFTINTPAASLRFRDSRKLRFALRELALVAVNASSFFRFARTLNVCLVIESLRRKQQQKVGDCPRMGCIEVCIPFGKQRLLRLHT